MQKETAAADARLMRLHQVQHQGRGNRRVDRIATGAQNLAAGSRRQGMASDDHLTLGPDRLQRRQRAWTKQHAGDRKARPPPSPAPLLSHDRPTQSGARQNRARAPT